MSRPEDASVFGHRVYRHQIEQAVADHLKAWVPTYHRFIERDLGLTAGHLEDPQSWQVTYELDKWPEQKLPAVVVTSPGQTDPMVKDGHGRYTGNWTMRAYVILTAGEGNQDDGPVSGVPAKLAGLYAAAIGLILVQKPHLTTIGGRCVQVSEGYDDTPSQMRRSMSVAHVPFTVQIDEVMSGGKTITGPDVPAPDPENPPPPRETYTSAQIDATSVPLDETP